MESEEKIPKCLGIIIDGNRRWAKNNGLSVFEGHQTGYKLLKEFIKWSRESGIKNIVAYIFSTENWGREVGEVSDLIKLIENIFLKDTSDFIQEKVSVRFIGELSMFSEEIRSLMKDLENKTASFSNQHVTFAVSYSGRKEIISAVKKCLQEGLDEITETDISEHLYDKNLPDPDIIIRAGGEMRLSGFLPWQSVYSELFFTKTLWPDFSKEEFLYILDQYYKRDRRMGR